MVSRVFKHQVDLLLFEKSARKKLMLARKRLGAALTSTSDLGVYLDLPKSRTAPIPV